MSEQIVTGKKYRILSDASQKIWHVISFITQAVDVFFSNGKNAQTTLGSITGISDSLTSTSSNVAASAAAVKALNDKITEISSNLGINKMTIYGLSYEVSDATYVKMYANTNGGKTVLVDSINGGNPLWVRGLTEKNNDNGTQLGYFSETNLEFDVSQYDYLLFITKSVNPNIFDGLRIE